MIAATNPRHELGIRKAAILVVSLDQAAADLLLDRLSPECASLVRQAVMEIDRVGNEEQQRVIDEFRRIGPMVPGKCPPGIELDSLRSAPPVTAGTMPTLAVGMSETLEQPSHAHDKRGHGTRCKHLPQQLPESDDIQEIAPPFDFLREAEEERLLQLLGSERPQTIALVLSHLPPERAGDVLGRFAPPIQVEIVRRLVDLENTDPETLREVEQTLEARLSRQFARERERAAGPDAVAKILASCNSRVVGNILDNLAAYDRPLAERLGHRPFEFDDLAQLNDDALLAVFRAADPEVAQAALLGALPQLVERLLCCMTAEEANRLRRKLDCPGPIRLSDIEDARRQIAALAQRMPRNNPSRIARAA